MQLSDKIREYLEIEKVPFLIEESRSHENKSVIKPVIVRADGKFIMCILAPFHHLDFNKIKSLLKASQVVLATERDLENLFPDFDLGCEPPFGELWGVRVYIDKSLLKEKEISFYGGNHKTIVKISLNDYLRLTNPIEADIVG